MSSIEGSQPGRPRSSSPAAGQVASRNDAPPSSAIARERSRRDSGDAPALLGSPITCQEPPAGEQAGEVTPLADFAGTVATFHVAATAEEVLQRLTSAACQWTGAEEAVGSWRGPQPSLTGAQSAAGASATTVAHQRGLPPRPASPSEPSVFDAILAHSGDTVRLSCADLETHPIWQQWTGGTKGTAAPLVGLLAVPLIGRDERTIGSIRVTAGVLEEFSAEDEALLAQLAVHASIAIENIAAVQQLRTVDQRKDEFLATLAHEIRNPLTSIRTGLDLLASGDSGHQLLEPMENQFEQLQRVVDDVMDVPRLVRGKIQLRRQQVPVGDVVQRAVDAARAQIDQHGHTLSVRLPETPLILDADPVRIAQSIGNLLTNAAKYTDRGGEISLDVRCEGEQIAFAVRDNGIGIDPELVPSVFELFQQADRTLDHAEGGLGIGLTLVKSLAEMHGGEITAHSEGKNRGSEFVLRLPIASASPEESPAGDPGAKVAPPPSGDPERRRLRILVVDDNRSATKMLARLIGKLGDHAVSVAHDGATALTLAQQENPDLVVLDIGLPEMSGHEVARRIRALPEQRAAMLVALTGYGEVDDRRESRESGFDLHLVKPIGIDDLRQLFIHPKLAQR